MNAYEEVCHWEKTEAVQTLRRCGLANGMTAMDLGCGLAHYTIPAAIAVGVEGRVIAVDKDKKPLKAAHQRIQDAELSNVEVLCANHLDLAHIPDSSIDFIMIYDMIHTNARVEMYPVIKRLLKPSGILSFLAFGEIRIRKNPQGVLVKSDNGKNITDSFDDALNQLRGEIESFEFEPHSIIENEGVHFDHFHSPYHWKRYGEVRLHSLERGNIHNYLNVKEVRV
ncbi:methyltransferase domain-containing protein [Paenibacillus sp. PR3]|uniref:Methyltransferase domain-containing protein n=1 Tax=Paenibacillus terricola TaxID=2763503 RepID=A0ABR8MR05_9BACL|nr:class I SAM-dependent methyltransferase [Paenibacillus terricola]MBD3918414.1 methyltransferase domain-containing protein [Paenibacillus terricola]